MKEPFFNLVDEPWIKVLKMDGEEDLLGLKEVYAKSHLIKTLAGETPLQDNAILRLLIAISVTCLYRYDKAGEEKSLADEKEAIARFKEIWDRGSFSEKFINTYLEKWYEKFYLIGGEYPFYQVPVKYIKKTEIKPDKKNPTGVMYSLYPHREGDKPGWNNAMGFNGEVLQSGNTTSPFTNKGEIEKNRMDLAEASRWLLYYMNYADCSAKIPGKWNAEMTFTSSGANIHPIGNNLFETIMLCSALLDANGLLYPMVVPEWEKADYTEINASPYGKAMPDNIPELYTQQSRKVILHYNGEYVDGMFTAAGDKYGVINSFIEPMFAFHRDTTDKSGGIQKPKHLPSECMGWKEYRHIFVNASTNPARWMNTLFDNDILSWDVNIPFVMNDISYVKWQCAVDYTVSTRITVSPKYFINSAEMEYAGVELEHVNEISGILRQFGIKIELAYGAKRDKKGRVEVSIGNKLVEEYELSVGKLIEQLLIDKIKDMDWLHREEIRMAEEVAEHLLDEVNLIGFIGHGDGSIGNAENWFSGELFSMKKKLGLMEGGENQ